jgi:hypothetical protein
MLDWTCLKRINLYVPTIRISLFEREHKVRVCPSQTFHLQPIRNKLMSFQSTITKQRPMTMTITSLVMGMGMSCSKRTVATVFPYVPFGPFKVNARTTNLPLTWTTNAPLACQRCDLLKGQAFLRFLLEDLSNTYEYETAFAFILRTPRGKESAK